MKPLIHGTKGTYNVHMVSSSAGKHNLQISVTKRYVNFAFIPDYLYQADAYMERKRLVAPVNYSGRITRLAELDIKRERITTMQNTITALNLRLNQLGPDVLTEDEISESVGILLNADDVIDIEDDLLVNDNASDAPSEHMDESIAQTEAVNFDAQSK